MKLIEKDENFLKCREIEKFTALNQTVAYFWSIQGHAIV